jgi:transcriptional regulator GlxA family with amidase domain
LACEITSASTLNSHISAGVIAAQNFEMPAAESLVDLLDASQDDMKDETDSLPSISTDDVYSDADSEAQAEWERSLDQLQLLLTMILVPWVGKMFGRKFAYWSEAHPSFQQTASSW